MAVFYLLQVELVANKDHRWHILGILDTENAVPHILQLLERVLRDDRVHEDKAVAVSHVHVAHGSELLLQAGGGWD